MSDAKSEDKFHLWTKDNFFRTSYTTMRTNVIIILLFSFNTLTQKPDSPKNYAIPGYQGYIPYVKAENIIGRPYTALTREAFSKPELGVNKFKISSTGFTYNPTMHIDPSASSITNKYGASTIPKPDPCWHVKIYFKMLFKKIVKGMGFYNEELVLEPQETGSSNLQIDRSALGELQTHNRNFGVQ